ncbi:putative homocysteine S-methyltransferase [Rosa chinensis]|uniref:Putative homocysteine S-methyltransferase n=1 Tax=Rosa chinensis TaxID=74649 RepID=A0A2P6QPD6_ROSCH|nr:putative homocysteine S-methyltransferase [Rosa chinensis]
MTANKLEVKATSKPIVIYPNSAETYDGQSKQWVPSRGWVRVFGHCLRPVV